MSAMQEASHQTAGISDALRGDPTTATRARQLPALFCFRLGAAAAVALLLVVSADDFQGLDRLLPDERFFPPYFTT
jgi:hypothetical protein